MRTTCFVLVLSGLAYANGETPFLDEARALLAAEDPARRSEGVEALAKLGTREALEALLPVLEDRKIGRGVMAAFVNAEDRNLATAVIDGALLHPEIPVGHNWVFTRAALGRKQDPLIDDGPFDSPRHLHGDVLTDEEQTRLLGKVAEALPVKRVSALAPAFATLVIFHHPSDHIAPAAARAWADLDEYMRAYLLGDEGWPLIQGEVMAAALPKTPMTERAASWHGDHARSLALRRLVEMGSKQAREEILVDMQRAAPRLTRDALLALEDEYLLDLEGVWARTISNRQFRDLTKLAPVIERYASGRMLDDVLALYREATGWACEIQAALLGYILKHSRETGIAEVRKALGRRGKAHTGCYRDALFSALPGHWSAEAEALALESLDDPEQDVRISAAKALIAAGSLRASGAVLALIEGLDRDDPRESSLRYHLLMPLVDRETWMADQDFERKLLGLLSVEDLHVLRLTFD